MAHVDFELAWVDLGDRLRAKPGWGAKELHELMAEVAAAHRLPENFVQQIVRLYGDSIHISITPETGAAVLGESETAELKLPDPEASTSKGDTDDAEHREGQEIPLGSFRPRRQREPAGTR
jgi:hypothetical protein